MANVGVRVRDLLKLPESVRKGDFVLSLADGIQRADETVDTYAITSSLEHCFDTAMAVIGSALQTRRSQAVYLHGSFGSGKSHFMAMLELLLEGHPAAWARTELHPLRPKHNWVGQKKIVRLPMHMIGAESLESKILSTYVDWVRQHHPDAPLPPVFFDEAVFADARAIREAVGDAAFFGKLNQGASTTAGWGALADQWGAGRFETAATSGDPAVRARLFSALGKTFITSASSQGYLDIDRGLGALSRHAASLGYDAVVLFLDELILWLAGHFSNLDFVQREAQKIAKLKEAQDEHRDVPIASFIARQRDLSELIGANALGAEQTTLKDSLAWSSGRFETIVIEDRNLPAVVERRVVQPRDDQARQVLSESFATMRKRLGNGAWDVLLGVRATEADFRKVYPFPPVVLEALVAVSDCLQRERTALKILMELLVEHLNDLEVGGLVMVGDVFDVVAGGEDPFDHVLKDRFDRAKALYRDHLLPLIRGTHGTGSRERCQRLRDEHPIHLGCSGCAETACRNDNRLAKSLLLAALVPQAEPFRDLTVRRLVQLNPGAVATPIPGGEVQIAAEKLRSWASHVGQLRVEEQDDPQVSLRLEGVDLGPILKAASEVDTLVARRRTLQRVLFEALGLPTEVGATAQKEVEWRGTKRPGVVRFANVREVSDAILQCPEGAEWYVLVDYPFDEPGHTPEEDVARLESYRDKHSGVANTTMVWLPTFFSDSLERDLGRLVVMEHILTTETTSRHLAHLRQEDQGLARRDLESLANATRAKIRSVLTQAYGLSMVTDQALLDQTRDVEEHFHSLQPGLEARPLLAASFDKALQQLAERLLEHAYPHHPRFEAMATVAKLERIHHVIERLLAATDRRQQVTQQEKKELVEIARPAELVQVGESVAELQEARLLAIERERQRLGAEPPSVEDFRRCLDPDGKMGLTPEVADLFLTVYAGWSGRELERGGVPLEQVKLGKIPQDAELVRPDLPSEEEWRKATGAAGHFFGLSVPGHVLNLRNVTTFADKVSREVAKVRSDATGLPDALQDRLQHWAAIDPPPPRLLTARSGAALVVRLQGVKAADLVRRLAAFVPETSPQALGKSLLTSEEVRQDLSDPAVQLALDQLITKRDDAAIGERARELIEKAVVILQADELNQTLGKIRSDLIPKVRELLRAPTPPVPPVRPAPVVPAPKPPQPGVGQPLLSVSEEDVLPANLDQALDKLVGRVKSQYARDGLSEAEKLKIELIIHRGGGN